jgi:hypothetical protein
MDTAPWQGPPIDVLGQTVPVQQFAARSHHVVVAVQHMIAFAEGCVIVLRLAARRGSLPIAVWERLIGEHLGADPDITANDPYGLKFGVRFPDGSKATSVDHPFPGWSDPADRPRPPMLVEAGSDSSSNDEQYRCNHELWLWPLPPPAAFELIIQWHGMGIEQTAVALDGAAVVRAAKYAIPLWRP